MKNGDPGPQDESTITEFPAQIDGGICTNCKADVSYIFKPLENGQINLGDVKACPECGHTLGRITKIVWRCKGCNTKIINPRKQTHCTGCGGKLKYPEEVCE